MRIWGEGCDYYVLGISANTLRTIAGGGEPEAQNHPRQHLSWPSATFLHVLQKNGKKALIIPLADLCTKVVRTHLGAELANQAFMPRNAIDMGSSQPLRGPGKLPTFRNYHLPPLPQARQALSKMVMSDPDEDGE